MCPLIPQLLVQPEPLGEVIGGGTTREKSAEGDGVLEGHTSSLSLVYEMLDMAGENKGSGKGRSPTREERVCSVAEEDKAPLGPGRDPVHVE